VRGWEGGRVVVHRHCVVGLRVRLHRMGSRRRALASLGWSLPQQRRMARHGQTYVHSDEDEQLYAFRQL
jgi:hypothetical protein